MTIVRSGWMLLTLSAASLHFGSAQASKPVMFPELVTKRLLNDLQIIAAGTNLPGDDMTIGLVVRYGAVYDPANKGGLAHLLSRMFFRAALDRTRKDLQDELQVLGATVDVRCDWDSMKFILRGPSARFERSLLLLYQAVGEAVFTDADFADVRGEMLRRLDEAEDPRQRIRLQLENALFKDTSYGRPITGTRASLQNITIGDVRSFYSRHFSPGSAALVIAGSASPQVVLQRATRIWGVWVRKDDVPFSFLNPRRPAARAIFAEDDPGSPAAQFILGSLWPTREEPAFYSGTLAARILQERLTKALPTSLLTVGAEGRRMPGPFYIQGQAAADQVGAEIRRILDAVEEMKGAPPTGEELAEARERWVTEFNRGLSSSEGICSVILGAELYRLGTNYMASFAGQLSSITPEAVQASAREWIFPGGVIVLVRGSMTALKPQLERLGIVQQIQP